MALPFQIFNVLNSYAHHIQMLKRLCIMLVERMQVLKVTTMYINEQQLTLFQFSNACYAVMLCGSVNKQKHVIALKDLQWPRYYYCVHRLHQNRVKCTSHLERGFQNSTISLHPMYSKVDLVWGCPGMHIFHSQYISTK